MGAGRIHFSARSGVESAVEAAAAICLAAAAAFAIFQLYGEGQSTLTAAAAGFAVTFLATRRVLDLVGGMPRPLAVPDFDPAAFEPGWADIRAELRPTADVAAAAPDDGALLLDDVLAELAPDARVVRLFEPGAVATAGELQQRIDCHLRGSAPQSPPDASEALHEALDVLRRSLR